MKKLIVYVNDIQVYVGFPKNHEQILKIFNSPNLHLYDDYTTTKEDIYFDENGFTHELDVRRVVFEDVEWGE